MSYRFTTRSTTPGEYRLVAGVLAQLLAASYIVEDIDRGDGVLGTLQRYRLNPSTISSTAGEVGQMTSGVLQLRRLVAESIAFQQRVGAADETAALKRIKTWDYEDDPVLLQSARPFAVVWPADRQDFEMVAGGGQNWLEGHGDVVLILTDRDRHPGAREQSGTDFAGWVDEVLADIAAASGLSDRMTINRIQLLQRPLRTATKDEPSAGAFWQAAFVFSW